MLGIADLMNNPRLQYLSLIIPVLAVVEYLLPLSDPYKTFMITWTVSILTSFIITSSFLFIRYKYRFNIDLLIIGWSMLFLVDVSKATNLMDPLFQDITAIFGKILIFLVMLSPRFSLFVDDLKQIIISGQREEYPKQLQGSFNLVNPGTAQRNKEIDWIVEHIEENSQSKTKTVLVNVYDLIAMEEVQTDTRNDILYIVRMIQGGRGNPNLFEEKVSIINDDLNNLDILLTDAINYANSHNEVVDVLIYTLSSLIHTHGWKRVYAFILSKMSQLKNSKVQIYCFYYPDSHENKADILKFEKTADSVVVP